MEIFCSFRLVIEGKTGTDIPEPSQLEFLENILANNFALSDAEDNTFTPLNWGGIAHLPFLRTLLAICKKSIEPSFWEVMDSFVLVAYASLATSRTLLQRLLACLNFELEILKIYFVGTNEKKKKIISAMAAGEAENHRDEWGVTWYLRWGIFIHQF